VRAAPRRSHRMRGTCVGRGEAHARATDQRPGEPVQRKQELGNVSVVRSLWAQHTRADYNECVVHAVRTRLSFRSHYRLALAPSSLANAACADSLRVEVVEKDVGEIA